MPRLVGLDVGTSSVKAVAIDPDGAVLQVAERGYPLLAPRVGWSEQDPEQWWAAAAEVLDACGAAEAAGIGLSGQMHGLVALDDDDRPLRPAILWNDGRTEEQCREIEGALGLDGCVALTGNRALAGCTAPTLLWLRDHEPHVYERIASIMLPKDYVRLRMSGEHATDAVDASGTLLFDVAQRRWSGDVLGRLDIPREWLPPVHESAATVGVLEGKVPVAAGAGDQAAAAVAAGVIDSGERVSLALGTSGVVLAGLDSYVAHPEGRTHIYCHALPTAWNAIGVLLSAAGSLHWLRSVVGAGESFDALLAEAAAWEPGVEGLRFAPQLAGERMPHADPQARGAFIGLALRHNRGALVRSVLEGVAFGLREELELVSGLSGRPVAARVSGGGIRSALWLEILASVLGVPLEICHVQEGAAYGAALLGGVAAGFWADVPEAVDACVRVVRSVEPRPEWIEPYEEQFAAFAGLYPALRALQA